MQASCLGSDIRGCKQKTITFSYPACSHSLIPVSFLLLLLSLLFVCFCWLIYALLQMLLEISQTQIFDMQHICSQSLSGIRAAKEVLFFTLFLLSYTCRPRVPPCSGAKQYVPHTPVELWDDWCGSISNNKRVYYQKYLWNRQWIGLNTGPSLSFRAVSFHMLSSCGNMLIICHVVAQTWVVVVQSDHRTQ